MTVIMKNHNDIQPTRITWCKCYPALALSPEFKLTGNHLPSYRIFSNTAQQPRYRKTKMVRFGQKHDLKPGLCILSWTRREIKTVKYKSKVSADQRSQ